MLSPSHFGRCVDSMARKQGSRASDGAAALDSRFRGNDNTSMPAGESLLGHYEAGAAGHVWSDGPPDCRPSSAAAMRSRAAFWRRISTSWSTVQVFIVAIHSSRTCRVLPMRRMKKIHTPMSRSIGVQLMRMSVRLRMDDSRWYPVVVARGGDC